MLQAQQFAHPAIDQGMEAIAGSLGIVHQLTQVYAPPTQPPTQPNTQGHGAHPGYAQGYGHPPQPPPEQVSPFAGTLMVEAVQPPPPQAPAQGNAAPHTQPSRNLPYGGRPEPKPQVAYVTPGAAPQAPQQRWDQPPQAAYGQPPQTAQQPAASPASTLASAGQSTGFQRVEAALGAHSTTNFYKGLSGNDIIESGGIFIATYQIPRIGSNLLIHVSLPGGYEFEAAAVVRWTREAPQAGGSDSPPGFGAQFTQISPEGRQLVYRYVRNREPLFHDDF
jgi:hypothetical protein